MALSNEKELVLSMNALSAWCYFLLIESSSPTLYSHSTTSEGASQR